MVLHSRDSGVIDFAGSKTKPMPIKAAEVASLLAQIKQGQEGTDYAVQFEVGITIKVADWTVRESERHCGRGRSRQGQVASDRKYVWAANSGGSGVLAG